MINDVFSKFSQAIRKFIGSKSIPSTVHSAHGKPSSTTMSVMNGNATTMSVANRVTKFPVNEMNSDLLVKQLIDSDFIYSRKVINKRIPNIIESSITAAINGDNLNVKESICTLDIFKLNKSIKQFVKILETLKLRQKLQFYVLCKNKHYLRLIDRMAKNYLLNKIIKTCTILPDLSHESRDTTKFLFVLGEYELTETFLYRLVYYRINIISNLNLKYERKTSGFYKIQNNLDDYKKLIFLFIFIQKILGKKNDSISFDHFSDTTTHSARRTLRDPVPYGHRRPSSTIHSVHRNNKNIITTQAQATPIAAVNAIHSGHRKPSSTTTTGGSSSVTAMNNVNRVTKFPTTEGSSGRKSVPSAHRKPSFTAINNVNSWLKSVPSAHRRPSSTIHSVHRNNKNIITVPSGHRRPSSTTQATPIAAVNATHSARRTLRATNDPVPSGHRNNKKNITVPSGHRSDTTVHFIHRRPSSTVPSAHRNNINIIPTHVVNGKDPSIVQLKEELNQFNRKK